MTTQTLALMADKLSTAVDLAQRAARDAHSDTAQYPDYLDVLRTLYLLSETVESAARTVAEITRENGASWSDIGHQWGGLTRQGAQQRWPDQFGARVRS